MSTKPKLGVDIDGCVYAFDEAARSLLRVRGQSVPAQESQHWGHLQEQVGDDAWHWLWGPGRREVFRCGPAYPNAIQVLKRLERHVRLVFITHRPIDCADVTLRWLADRKLHPYAVFHVAGRDKGAVVPDCLAYVEDRTENARAIVQATGAPVLVPRRGWNQDVWGDEGITTFDDWEEVESWVIQRT